MKQFIFLCFVVFFLFEDLLSQPIIEQAEILFRNATNHDLILEVSPASSTYSGFFAYNIEPFRRYTMERSNPNMQPFWPLRKNDTAYIVGGRKSIEPGEYVLIDFDNGLYYSLSDSAHKVLGCITYGLWKFEIFYTDTITDSTYLFDEFYLDERDINYAQYPFSEIDMFFTILRRSGASTDSILFRFQGAQDSVNLHDNRIIDKTIKSWHILGLFDPI